MQHVTIPERFNEPPTSGNGGCSAGLVAGFLEGSASVRLHSRPPLDTPLQVSSSQECVEVFHGETLVATGRPVQLDIDVPEAPGLDTAYVAREGFPGFERRVYPTCFVCGPGRPLGSERRKFYGGAAVASGDGELLAAARATWIAMD